MKSRVPIIIAGIAAATLILAAGISACPVISGENPVYQSYDPPILILHAPFYREDKDFPYQCGPFPENLPYGPNYDERCVYPYYLRDRAVTPEKQMTGPIVSLSTDVSASWSSFDVLDVTWHGNPNGVTRVEFALLDNNDVVVQRMRVDYPPYARRIHVPYGAVGLRVRTYGLLQSVLQQSILPLPLR